MTAEARRLLATYSWPGNVRELKNLAERLAVRGPGEPVRADHLPLEYLHGVPIPADASALDPNGSAMEAGPAPENHTLLRRLLYERESFWTAVHRPFMDRESLARTAARSDSRRTRADER